VCLVCFAASFCRQIADVIVVSLCLNGFLFLLEVLLCYAVKEPVPILCVVAYCTHFYVQLCVSLSLCEILRLLFCVIVALELTGLFCGINNFMTNAF
jgi:uncharacterized membrane protein YhfC